MQAGLVRRTGRDIVKTLAALPLIRLNRSEPDLILYNGLLSTMYPGQPEATAVAISAGRFLAAGSDQEVLALAGKRTRRVDLISKLYASHGITSACEADTSPAGLQGYQDARDAGELRYRAYCLMDVAYLDRYIDAGLHTGFGDSMVRIAAICRPCGTRLESSAKRASYNGNTQASQA
jgi:predicted amidohydrolase YtcJ